MGRSQRVKGAAFEREIAARLGCSRNIGQARDGGDDVTFGPLRIECKRRRRIAVVQAWVEQAAASCEREGDIPVVIARQDHGEPLVVMRFEDWMQVMGPMLDGIRSALHTASYGAAQMGRPRQFLTAPAARLQPQGGVRGGTTAPYESVDKAPVPAPSRRRKRSAPAQAGARGPDNGGEEGQAQAGDVLPSPEPAPDS